MSADGGKDVTYLSQDHKSSDPDEYNRIIAGGGQVYQTTTATSSTDVHGKPLEGKIISPRTAPNKT